MRVHYSQLAIMVITQASYLKRRRIHLAPFPSHGMTSQERGRHRFFQVDAFSACLTQSARIDLRIAYTLHKCCVKENVQGNFWEIGKGKAKWLI